MIFLLNAYGILIHFVNSVGFYKKPSNRPTLWQKVFVTECKLLLELMCYFSARICGDCQTPAPVHYHYAFVEILIQTQEPKSQPVKLFYLNCQSVCWKLSELENFIRDCAYYLPYRNILNSSYLLSQISFLKFPSFLRSDLFFWLQKVG